LNKLIQGIIIGGSPSTGSSLLRQILNRHSEIICAPETHIWCKERVFQHWDKYKNRYLKKSIFGLSSEGLYTFIGIDKSEIPDYDKKKTAELLQGSPDIYTFFRLFMMEYFGLGTGQLYGEKTPANAVNFKYILNSSNDVLCVHTVRNPYDAIASLVARGNSPITATAYFLFNCAHGLDYRNDPRLETIRYENLVQDPEKELSSLMGKLNLSFENKMLSGKSVASDGIASGKVTKLAGWNYDETEKIQKGSVGRFDQLGKEEQDEILYYARYLHFENERNLKVKSIKDICDKLNYQFIEPQYEIQSNPAKELKKHKRTLTRKMNNFDFTNYPFYFA